MKGTFTEQDITRFRTLISKINVTAKFEFSVREFVEFYNELEWVLKTVIPKMTDNVFQVESVKETKEEASPEETPPVEKPKSRSRRAKA